MKNILFAIIIIVICIYTFIPHQRIETKPKNFNVYIKEDNTYVNLDTNEMPKDGYILNTTESSCTDGATISQDFNSREVSVTSTKEAKCNFYFDEYNPNIVEVKNDNRYDASTVDVIDNGTIGTGSSACTNTVAYDNTTDNNLRYVGKKPCNYVTFNGETAGWRIVGIMNNVDDGTGNLETRIKLIRKDTLGNYSWDTSVSGENGATTNYGINDWTQADLKNELNGDYLDTTLQANTNWYNGSSNQQTGVYDYTKGLTSLAQAQIGNTKWYLGGMRNNSADLIPSTMYTLERGNKVWGSTSGQTCNDGYCPRSLNWIGKVALIYPSDYGYATAGGSTTNRSACIGTLSTYNNISGETWNNGTYSTYSDCYANDWISYGWALSPASGNFYNAMKVDTGIVAGDYARNTGSVRPAVYLESSVTISGGNGSQESPFTLTDNII